MMMPPSPAMSMRFSLGRETEKDEYDDDDDDLALFNEMESMETQNFLLLPSDDLEDSLCKLRHFSDIKHGNGISVPGSGETETSDMLNAADDDDKNDYDWLLTPPDTPLFPSLDDEPPQIDIIVSRGRPHSKPISISSSSSMEKSIRSSRGSPSPNRFSPSPCSGNSTMQSRGRPSSSASVSNSSPTPSLRHATPQRKPSSSPNKDITPAARSSTPTLRRISTGSSTIRGASPVKTNRGNSASPRLRAWKTSIPDRDYISKSSRQSMSTTASASRSSSSLHSHDQDRVFSSRNKGSFASSGDDDLDFPKSIQVGSLDRPSSRKGGSFSNIKSSSFTKKPAKMMSPNSAPKRSFDSALRQKDKRNPQNMFRPLLSSVPSTTFCVGKANSAQRSLVSRNSSVTTSSNASSDHGTSFAPDTEDDGVSETEKILYSDIHEEVFSLDEIDILDANIGHEIINESLHILDYETRGPKIAAGPTESEDSVCHVIDTELNDSSETSHFRSGISELGCSENTATCCSCDCRYEVTDQAEKNIRLCPECKREGTVLRHITPETTLAVFEDSSLISANFSAEEKPLDETDQLNTVFKLPQVTDVGNMRVPLDEQAAEESLTSSGELIHGHSQQSPLPSSLVGVDQSGVDHKKPDDHSSDQQLYHSEDRSNLKIDLLEGAGISLLLKRSSSSRGPLVQGRTFTATTLSCDDLSLGRHSINSFRSLTACGSYSASSSVDFSPARRSEFRVQLQASGRKLDVDTRTKRSSTGSSISGTSNYSHHGLGLGMQETTLVKAEEDMTGVPREMVISEDALTDVIDASSTVSIVVEEDKLEYVDCGRLNDASKSEVLSQTDDNSVPLFLDHGICISYDHVEDHPNDSSSVSDTESVKDPESFFDEKHDAKNTSVDGLNAVVTIDTFTITESELEGENYCQNDTGMVDDDSLQESKSAVDVLQEQSVPNFSNDCVTASVSELNASKYLPGIGASTVTVDQCEGGGNNTRSMTLEEATDTILLCSSIIHDLSYQAATIAMEKDQHSDSFEGYEPRVTILGKVNSDIKESCDRTGGKRALKNQKEKPIPAVETDVKSPPANKLKNDENVDEYMPRIVGLPDEVDGMSMKPPNKLESKCNCIIM